MRRNGPIWEAIKRGGRVAYHGYRRRRLEGKLASARAAEARAWSGNPRTGIPGRVLEVRYARGGKDAGRYTHRYGPNVRFRLGPGRSQVTLYHARGEPIWADERGRDFDKWVDLDHHRRMNPRRRAMARRRRRSSRSSGISTQTWLLIGIGAYLWYTGALNRFVPSPATGTFTVPSGAAM